MNSNFQENYDLIQELCPMDDTFFEVLIQQPGVCEEMLRILLEDSDLTVLEVHPQHSIKKFFRRSVRLDALCVLSTGELANIEIQQGNKTNHFKRVRYNEACAITQTLETGTDFEKVPIVYSLYISDFDMFHKGKTIYHSRKSIIETDQTIDDGCHELYTNIVIDDGTLIAEYLQQLKSCNINNPKFPYLTQGMKYLKQEQGGITTMNASLQKFADKYAEEKLKNARLETITRMIKRGDSVQSILELDFTPEEYSLAKVQLDQITTQ